MDIVLGHRHLIEFEIHPSLERRLDRDSRAT